MTNKLKLAIFISGGGTNMQAIVRNCLSGIIDAEVAVVVSNEPQAGGIVRARKLGLPVEVVDHRSFPDRESHEKAVIEAIAPYRPDLIVLAGYMRIITPVLLNRFYDNNKKLPGIINIHPADTAAYQGTHGYEFAMGLTDKGGRLQETKITVHFVDSGMDTGPVIRQRTVPIQPDDTLGTLRNRGLEIEYEIYSEVIQLLAEERIIITNGQASIRPKG